MVRPLVGQKGREMRNDEDRREPHDIGRIAYEAVAVVTGSTTYIGIYFCGDGARKFWRVTCPCGIVAEYPVNGLPEVDTPHPCGHKNHWTVKYDADSTPNAKSQRRR